MGARKKGRRRGRVESRREGGGRRTRVGRSVTQFERRAFSNGAKVERDRGNFSWSWQSSRRASRTRRRRRDHHRVCRSFTLALSPTTTATDIFHSSYFVRAFLSIVRRRLIVPHFFPRRNAT